MFSLAFTSDNQLISCGKDGIVKLHDRKLAKSTVLLQATGAVRAITLLGRSLAVGCEDSTIFYTNDYQSKSGFTKIVQVSHNLISGTLCLKRC